MLTMIIPVIVLPLIDWQVIVKTSLWCKPSVHFVQFALSKRFTLSVSGLLFSVPYFFSLVQKVDLAKLLRRATL